jgi:tRNA threonylcarbamoyladenosine biosynthesis protein TsaE
MDAYRLLAGSDPLAELEDLDLDVEGAVTVIEWGGELVNRLSENYLEVNINRDEDVRLVSVVGHGARWRGFEI